VSQSEDETKPNIGRPTKYKEEYCELLIAHMAKGYSFESFASTINVNRDSLYEWTHKHEDFSDAKKVGKDKSLFTLEQIGMAGMTGKLKGFNVAAWIYTLKNRHNDLYSDNITLTSGDKPFVLNYTVEKK
jgi:hypothetical protein